MKRQSRVFAVMFVVVMASCGWMKVAEGDDLSTKCASAIEKVPPCLTFATGKKDIPSDDCCAATLSIKQSNPECLCYIIELTHKGSPQVKELGIQEDKLLQLPSACHMKNASITDCPSKHFHPFPKPFFNLLRKHALLCRTTFSLQFKTSPFHLHLSLPHNANKPSSLQLFL